MVIVDESYTFSIPRCLSFSLLYLGLKDITPTPLVTFEPDKVFILDSWKFLKTVTRNLEDRQSYPYHLCFSCAHAEVREELTILRFAHPRIGMFHVSALGSKHNYKELRDM